MGRSHGEGALRHGPRVIDLDILMHGDDVVDVQTPDGPLRVPHARESHESDAIVLIQ
jgi:7,8-dihydro-6-hydroxymethylpterin-pyrophosphokinase